MLLWQGKQKAQKMIYRNPPFHLWARLESEIQGMPSRAVSYLVSCVKSLLSYLHSAAPYRIMRTCFSTSDYSSCMHTGNVEEGWIARIDWVFLNSLVTCITSLPNFSECPLV